MLRLNLLIPPPVVAALIGALMWALGRLLPSGQFRFPAQEAAAIVLFGAGLLLLIAAAVQFIAARTTINPLKPANASHLVTTGVFAFSRNPIYLGDLLMLAAFAVWLGNAFSAALPAAFVWYMNRFQILPEERALSQIFGGAYDAYCSRVRRWL
jgi:protein-S-isoprenylcysteine O-methyltransferase Ste14